MQVVARELADDLPVQIYLLEMAAAVVQMALRSAVRKVVADRLPSSSYWWVRMPCAVSSLQHPPQSVVAEADNFRRVSSCRWRRISSSWSAASWTYSYGQLLGVFFAVSRPAASRASRWRISPPLPPVPGEHHFRDRVQRVVAVRLAAAVPASSAPPDGPAHHGGTGSVLRSVRERDQTPVSVVPERRPAPHRARPAAHPALPVPLPARYPPHPAGCTLPACPPRLTGNSPCGRPPDHLRQVTAVVIPVARAVALRIRHSDKPRAFVVEPGRLRAGTVRVPHESLPSSFHWRYLFPPRASVICTT